MKNTQSFFSFSCSCSPLQHERGFFLVTVSLLLMVISMVAMGIVEDSLLESKMSNYWGQKTIAFYNAESALKKAEADILQGKNRKKYRRIQQECGVDFYLAEAKAKYHDANVNLQSSVAVVDKGAHCQSTPQEKDGRQSWLYSTSS